jgi:RimJ/RimL family protein N-acetyltransferase
VIVETRRLRLREITTDDLDAVAGMVGDEEQMRFYARPRTYAEAAAWIERTRATYRERGFGFWAVESRPDARFIGYCGIRPLTLDGVPETEIGWHIDKGVWNRGIATEAAVAARDVAAQRFEQARLVAIIRPENAASCRVAEKIGLRRESTAVVDDDLYLVYAS